MSKDELLQMWCLHISNKPTVKDKPFFLDASVEWNVDQLTQAIQKRKYVLRDSDTSDIVIWKLKKPIPVDPINTLPQRLPTAIPSFCVELESTQNVTAAFPSPKKNYLQLIAVTSLGDDTPPENKRRRLNGPEDSDEWDPQFLWQTFWGQRASECFVTDSICIPNLRTLKKETKRTQYQYLKLPNDNTFPCDLSKILITETYTTLYERLCKEDEAYAGMPKSERTASLAHSTIIAGQPGTGKTVGLSCILVWRLQEKKPTIYCSHSSYAYVFTGTGVEKVLLKSGNRIGILDGSTHSCLLVDINPRLMEVPTQFRPSQKRQGRVVVATSPNPSHVNAFKQDRARTYYTPTWKWPDLYCAGLLRFSSLDPEDLRRAYTSLGGIPWRCFRALSANGFSLEMLTIQDAINEIQDIQNFVKSANGSMHTLVRLEPKDATWTEQTTYMLSDHVTGLVYEKIMQHKTMKIRDSIVSLLRIPKARSWGGQLFEMAVHRILRNGFAFEPKSMDARAPRLHVKIKKATLDAGGYFHKLSVRAEPGSRKVGAKYLNQYLIPLSSTAEAIDSASIAEDVTVLLQITVSSIHPLNLEGITELVDELPYNAKKRICIVFIVPDHDTTPRPYKRQPIVVPLEVPESLSKPVLAYNQYVFYFPMDKL